MIERQVAAQPQLHGLQSRPDRTKYLWAATACSCAVGPWPKSRRACSPIWKSPRYWPFCALVLRRDSHQATATAAWQYRSKTSQIAARGDIFASGRAARRSIAAWRRSADSSSLVSRPRAARSEARALVRVRSARRGPGWLSKKRMVLRARLTAVSFRSSRSSSERARVRLVLAAGPDVVLSRGEGEDVVLDVLEGVPLDAAAAACVTSASANRPTSRALKPCTSWSGTGARPTTATARVSRSGNSTRTGTNRCGIPYKLIGKSVTNVIPGGNARIPEQPAGTTRKDCGAGIRTLTS